ncbi:MAG: metallophosphoesterase [Chloroflexota bacterium]|nr:metallophosphoesterase [Chloroflexota bacterium]
MPRRAKPKTQKRGWRWYASMALNGAVALSMVLGTVFLFTGAPRPTPPTIEPPTVESNGPTLTPPPALPPATPAPAPPTPTPKASAIDSAAPPGAGALTFAVAGDSRDGDVIYSRLLQRVASDGSEFLIHLGDLVPTGSASEWAHFRTLMKDFRLPFYPVPGNHDTQRAPIDNYLKNSGAPAAHYSFDRGGVHFTFLDTDTGTLGDQELAFLDADLTASRAPIKMVLMHHPPFDPAGGAHILDRGNERFMQVVAQRGVRYVFAGHIHCYEEGARDGVRYIITGGAGSPLTCLPIAGGFYHYVRVRVRGDAVTTDVVRIE